LYDNLCNLEDLKTEDGWQKYYDEPDKRTFYKQEEGYAYGSVITDCIVDASIQETIGCYDNIEILDTLMPEFNDLEWKIKVTDVKGLLYGKQRFPWPMWSRDMTMHVTGIIDYKNHGLISVSKSIDVGEKYYEYTI